MRYTQVSTWKVLNLLYQENNLYMIWINVREKCSKVGISSLQGSFLKKFANLTSTGDAHPPIPLLGRLRKTNFYQFKKLLLRTQEVQEAGIETQFSRHTCITCTVFWMGVLVKWTSTFF